MLVADKQNQYGSFFTLRLRIFFLLFYYFNVACAQQQPLRLLYKKPAREWNEALPLGNGRLGAMVFGGAQDELIQLNEETLWTGGPVNPNPNPEAHNYLKPVRDALFRDSIDAAVKLLRKMQGPNTQMYQPLGDVMIKQHTKGSPINYSRSLDIEKALASVQFEEEGVVFKREMFISAPHRVMIIRFTSSKPRQLDFSVGVGHPLNFLRLIEDQSLVLKGKARITSDERRNPKPIIYNDENNCKGMRFQFRVKPILCDGKIETKDSILHISSASEVVLAISAATSFNGFDKCPDSDGKDEQQLVLNDLKSIQDIPYRKLLTEHIKDYQKYFKRLDFQLDGIDHADQSTDLRLDNYKKGKSDPFLEVLYYQYGRYLLISSSRPGGYPANLQGIWNKEIRPSWRSNYTTNINVQMNYWLADMCNLKEMMEPFISHAQRWQHNGEFTAQNYYKMKGWALHHNSDIWAQTNPVGEGGGDPKWANWSLGSPWISQHLFEHYRFTKDISYLKQVAYPVMKGAAEFCLDWLVEKDGQQLTAPSTSPENVYLHPNGFKGTVTIASAMDMEIIWDCFTNFIEASGILGIDTDFIKILKQKKMMLSPLKIGKKGNLVEWFGDWEDEDPEHRHVSHLFGLHPGRQISPFIDTAFANASRKTLQVRGDGGTGWSKAWKINFWARLLDGDHAYTMYQQLLKTSTLNNLFDTHPPFQIDGNFGATAGVTEMLLQSQLSDIHILPALPRSWRGGSVKGMRARGNYELSFNWIDGQLQSGTITSKSGGGCKIRTDVPISIQGRGFKTAREMVGNKIYYITSFKTNSGCSYRFAQK